MFNLVYCFARKNSWRIPQELIIGALISQFASYLALFHSLHSSINKEQHETIHPAITDNMENMLVKRVPISRNVKAVTSQFQLCRTRHSKQDIAQEVPH